MDPHSCAQDVPRCDLCETTLVHSYCDLCHVNLCKPCVVDHISDGYDKHKVVSFQERRSTLIYPKCETHPHRICEFQCKDCNTIFVCSSCMASEQHKGHNFVEVREIYKTMKEDIKKDTKEFENHIFPTYEEIALDLETQLAKLDGGYEKLTTTMSKQGEQWHREIDIVINKMKTEVNEIKVKHRDILKKHLHQIKQTQSLIKQTIQAIRKIEKSTDVSSTIEYSSKIREFSQLPPKVQVSLPTFIPKPIDREKLYSLLGQITPSTATEESVLVQNQPNTSVRELLDEPELVATIQTGYEELRSVTCLNDGSIWTSGKTNDIKCFNIKVSLLQTIKTKSEEWPNDITVDSDGNLLYCDWTEETVNVVKNGQIEELITLPEEWTPNQLCVTSTGDLLVAMFIDDDTQSKVVRYSGSTEKQTIQFDDEGKPLYSRNDNIKYITENRNRDICVADLGAGAVVVVNQDGKLRWRYTGHPSVTKNEPFKPWGITTDSQSRILTADTENHCIHILDQNGQFLRYIDKCGLEDPSGLCVDNNDNLFVCEYSKGNVKKIKYLK